MIWYNHTEGSIFVGLALAPILIMKSAFIVIILLWNLAYFLSGIELSSAFSTIQGLFSYYGFITFAIACKVLSKVGTTKYVVIALLFWCLLTTLHLFETTINTFFSGFAKIRFHNPWISNWWRFKLIITLLRRQVCFYFTNTLITRLFVVTVINIVISALILCAVSPLDRKKRSGGKWPLT